MVRSRSSCSKTKRSFSSITLLVFHGMRLFYTQLPKFCSVRDAPGPFCQGCARSVPPGVVPPSPLFSQVLILKVVKVLCFDTLLQVLILKVVSQGPMRCRLEASLSRRCPCRARFRRAGCRSGYRLSGGTTMTGACCSWAMPSSRRRTWAGADRELCDDQLPLAPSHDEPEQTSANQ